MHWLSTKSSPAGGTDSEKLPFIPLEEEDIFNDQESDSTLSHSTVGSWRTICSAVLRFVLNVVLELLPSFAVNAFTSTRLEKNDRGLPQTAFLDGIRGFASLFVFFYHFAYAWQPRTRWGYGSPGDENNWYIVQLPFVRLFHAGPSMVMVFFVISGFALSYKALHLLRNGSLGAALLSLSSSVFRRPVRLFLPPLTSTLIIVLLLRLGAYEPSRSYADDPEVIPGWRENHPMRFETIWEQIKNWVLESHKMCDLFQSGGVNPYDEHLWTVPIEFHSSMSLFFTILSLSKMKPVFRIVMMIGLLLYTIHIDTGSRLSFCAGMVIAELWLATRSKSTKLRQVSKKVHLLMRLMTAIWWIIFITGLYIASMPIDLWADTPGYSFLVVLVDDENFWFSTGAFLIVWSASNSESVQTLFTNRLAQYLGKISYALYLCHGMFLHTMGYTLIPKMWKFTGRETLAQYELGFGLAAIFVISSVIWAADVFWRFVDLPAVKLARRDEEMVSVGHEE